jgi:hypothetical protein
MMDSGLTKTAIDDYLQKGLDGDHCTSFQSADELWELLENIEFGFGPRSWTSFEIESGTLWTRNILQCIQLFSDISPSRTTQYTARVGYSTAMGVEFIMRSIPGTGGGRCKTCYLREEL